MAGIMDAVMSLLGPDSSLMKLLGSEGMGNLMTGVMAGKSIMDTGKMMDFTMDKADKVEARAQSNFDRDNANEDNRSAAFDGIEQLEF